MDKHKLVGTTIDTRGWLGLSELQEYVDRLRWAHPTVRAFGVDGDPETLLLLGTRAGLADLLADEFTLDAHDVDSHLRMHSVESARETDNGSRYEGRHRLAQYDPSFA